MRREAIFAKRDPDRILPATSLFIHRDKIITKWVQTQVQDILEASTRTDFARLIHQRKLTIEILSYEPADGLKNKQTKLSGLASR